MSVNSGPTANFDFQHNGDGSFDFDGSLSLDPDGDSLAYLWVIDGKNYLEGQLTNYQFELDGNYVDVTWLT